MSYVYTIHRTYIGTSSVCIGTMCAILVNKPLLGSLHEL